MRTLLDEEVADKGFFSCICLGGGGGVKAWCAYAKSKAMLGGWIVREISDNELSKCSGVREEMQMIARKCGSM